MTGESLEELAAQAERSRLEAIEEARLARVLAQAEAEEAGLEPELAPRDRVPGYIAEARKAIWGEL